MDRESARYVQRLFERLERKIMLAAGRAVVSLVRDNRKMQGLQVTVLDGEVMDPEHMQPGGLTHVAPAGAEGVFLTMGGERDDGVVVCVSSRGERPKGLASGETALYNATAQKTTITIRANGDVEVALADGAKLRVGGNDADYVALAGKVDAALADIAAHTHTIPDGVTGAFAVSSFDSVAAELTLTE